MRRYTELLAALALSTGMALHAQTNEMVIQTKKRTLCRTGKEPFIRIPSASDGMEDLWKGDFAG